MPRPRSPPPEILARLNGILAQVADPEIPVLSVLDLGVIRHLLERPDGSLEVGISPTYSGCPANAVIKADVLRALQSAGFAAVAVDVLAPPWSSDWLRLSSPAIDARKRAEEGLRQREERIAAPLSALMYPASVSSFSIDVSVTAQ